MLCSMYPCSMGLPLVLLNRYCSSAACHMWQHASCASNHASSYVAAGRDAVLPMIHTITDELITFAVMLDIWLLVCTPTGYSTVFASHCTASAECYSHVGAEIQPVPTRCSMHIAPRDGFSNSPVTSGTCQHHHFAGMLKQS